MGGFYVELLIIHSLPFPYLKLKIQDVYLGFCSEISPVFPFEITVFPLGTTV